MARGRLVRQVVEVGVSGQEKAGGRLGRGVLPWLATVAVGALLLLLYYGLSTQRLQTGVVPAVNATAPDFRLTTFAGPPVHLAELRGKPVVVNFWASWCVPCKDEQPGLNLVWTSYRDRGVTFVGINIQDTARDALGFLRQNAIGYAV